MIDGFSSLISIRLEESQLKVKELARQGKIFAIKVGKLSRFPEDFLKTWVRKVIF
jgi:excisionase family DNA binding protein